MATSLDPNTNQNSGTLSNANLTYTATSSLGNCIQATVFTTTNFYFEAVVNSGGPGYVEVGLINKSQGVFTPEYSSFGQVPAGVWGARDDGYFVHNGTGVNGGGPAWAGSTLMVACVPSAGKMWCGENGTWFNSGNPVTGANPIATGLSGIMGAYTNLWGVPAAVTFNFGGSAYSYTPPSGFCNLMPIVIPLRKLIHRR